MKKLWHDLKMTWDSNPVILNIMALLVVIILGTMIFEIVKNLITHFPQ